MLSVFQGTEPAQQQRQAKGGQEPIPEALPGTPHARDRVHSTPVSTPSAAPARTEMNGSEKMGDGLGEGGAGDRVAAARVVYQILIDSPQLVLVERCEDAGSALLVLQTSCMAKCVYLPDGSQQAQVHVQDFSVSVGMGGCDEPESAARSKILEPVSLSLQYALSVADAGSVAKEVESSSGLERQAGAGGEGGEMQVSVTSSDVSMFITYQEARTILRIATSLESSPADSAPVRAVAEGESFSHRGEPDNRDPSSRVPGASEEEGESAAASVRRSMQVEIVLGTVKVVVVNDCAGYNQPFVAATLDALHVVHLARVPGSHAGGGGHGKGEQQEDCTMIRAQVEVAIFNQRLLQFEPVVEPWTFTLERSRAPRRAKSDYGAEAVADDLDRAEEGWLDAVHVESSSMLNVNLTEHQMNTVCTTLLAWQTDMDASTAVPASDDINKAGHYPDARVKVGEIREWSEGHADQARASRHAEYATRFAAYRINNDCGVGLRVSSGFRSRSRGHPHSDLIGPDEHVRQLPRGDEPTEAQRIKATRWIASQYVKPMETQPLCFVDSSWPRFSQKGGPRSEEGDLSLSVQIDGIGEAGMFEVDLQKPRVMVREVSEGARVLTTVETDPVTMSTRVSLRSSVSFHNRCHVALEVRIWRVADDVEAFRGCLPACTSLPLPPSVQVAEAEFQVSVRSLQSLDWASDDEDTDVTGASAGSADVRRVWSSWDGWGKTLGATEKIGSAKFPSPVRGNASDAGEEGLHEWSAGALLVPGLDQVLESNVGRLPIPGGEAGMGTAWEADKHSPCFVRAVTEFKDCSVDGEEGGEGGLQGVLPKFTTVTISLMPVLMVRNLLPCELSFAFLLAGDHAPMPGYRAAPGERVAVHEFGLSRQVSMGLSIAGLDEGSEYVPVFCADGSSLETHVVLYDANQALLRLALRHEQQAQRVFRVDVFAPFWVINRVLACPFSYVCLFAYRHTKTGHMCFDTCMHAQIHACT